MLVRALSDSSSEVVDLEEDVDDADFGCKSGALYASMFVVWVSAIGLEILLRIDPECAWPLATVLLRCGRTPISVEGCFARLVVSARAKDILTGDGGYCLLLFNS